MNRTLESLRKIEHWSLVAIVTVLGIFVLWPVPMGMMPLSADHTVHLSRAAMWSDALAQGHLRDWSDVWFFGTPVGELYPVLGDVLVIAPRWLSFGTLSWPTCYALGFTVVFLAQGWVLLRAGRAMGWGSLPGLVAATLVLVDVGSYREGGWLYTVYYGVWPQSLATSLAWLGIAELCAACRQTEARAAGRSIAAAGLAMGAALLAHPMSMLVLAVAGPIVVLTMGVGRRAQLARATTAGLVVGGLALSLAAWWLIPMLTHRAWMASYGWLWLPLDTMLDQVLEGRWCQSMPPAVGHCITAGLLLVAVVGSRTARAFGATAVVLWLMSSRDVPWLLRLDLVSEGFTHLQYQRFVTAAKPGLFLMAGALVGGLAVVARRTWDGWEGRLRPAAGKPLAVLAAAGCVAASLWMLSGQRDVQKKNPVSEIQLERLPAHANLDKDYTEFIVWMTQAWSQREHFWRVAVRDQRNTHWFMDAPALADGVPIFKLGFTPGDNFTHKPEKGSRGLLDLAQARYEVRRGRRRSPDVVQTFGEIQVIERPQWAANNVATVRGQGVVEIVSASPDEVRVRVSQAAQDTRLVFGIGGFPRWHLTGPNGEAVEWFEAPIVGDGPTATQGERRAGVLRGGKAHGNDGTEPTLIAADIGDQSGEYTLTYRRWNFTDLLALLISGFAGLCIAGLLRPWQGADLRLQRIRSRLRVLGRPLVWLVLAIALVLLGGVRIQRGQALEATTAFGVARQGQATVRAASAGFHKADMLIRPAIVFDRRHRGAASVQIDGVRLGETLSGWVALEDDDAKKQARGTQRLGVQIRRAGAQEWTPVFERKLAHRPGLVPLSIPTGAYAGQQADVRIVLESEGKRPPQVGFDLELPGIGGIE